jgi:hypothetical protein
VSGEATPERSGLPRTPYREKVSGSIKDTDRVDRFIEYLKAVIAAREASS